jgi:signal transduction histidine kinase
MSIGIDNRKSLAPYVFPVLIGVSIFMVVVLGWTAFQNNRFLGEVFEKEKKVFETLDLLNEIERLALDLETGGRGFVITGDENFLAPYESATVELAGAMPQLKRILSDNPELIARQRVLEELINAKVEKTAENIAVRRQLGLQAAIAIVSLGEGRAFMDDVRRQIAGMRELLTASRTDVLSQLSSGIRNNSWVLALIGGFAILLASFFVYGESRRRSRAEARIIDANEILENRVSERTLELNQVNAELQGLLDDRGRLLENEKAARGEAEIANKIRDEFMAALSHELRNPLNSILGWARILKRSDLDEGVVAKAVDAIISSSETQNNIIDDLLDIARIVSGNFRFDMRPVNPSDLVHGAVESFRPLALAKEIEIRLAIQEGLDRSLVSGDLNRLRQVIWNLLSNALKFSDVGSEIDVSVSLLGKGIEISVADRGMGIRPRFLPFIFDRFRQDAPPQDFSTGLGLGLPIVRAITEIHGGEVKAFSEGEGKGSVFSILLPLNPESDSSQSQE